MISKFFIDRPVLANVLAIVIVLIGAVSAFSLPIAQYPNRSEEHTSELQSPS